MTAIGTWFYQSDNDLELVAPVLRSTNATLTTGSCAARLFDVRRDDIVEAQASAVLALSGSASFNVGETAVVWLSNNTTLESVVAAVNYNNGTVTLTDVPGAAVKPGARITRKIGASVAMTAYNASSANPDTTDWGWRGVVPDTQADVEAGMTVLAEVKFTATGGQVVIRHKLFKFFGDE